MKSCPCHPKSVWLCLSTAPAGLCWHPKPEIEAQDTPRVESKRIQGFLSHQKRFDKLLFAATVICAFRSVTVFSARCKPARAHRLSQLTTKCKKSTKFKTDSLCLIIKHFLKLFTSHLLPIRKKIDRIQFIESFQPCISVIPDTRTFPLCHLDHP